MHANRFRDSSLVLAAAMVFSAATDSARGEDDKSWSHPVISVGILYLREQNQWMAYQLRP